MVQILTPLNRMVERGLKWQRIVTKGCREAPASSVELRNNQSCWIKQDIPGLSEACHCQAVVFLSPNINWRFGVPTATLPRRCPCMRRWRAMHAYKHRTSPLPPLPSRIRPSYQYLYKRSHNSGVCHVPTVCATFTSPCWSRRSRRLLLELDTRQTSSFVAASTNCKTVPLSRTHEGISISTNRHV